MRMRFAGLLFAGLVSGSASVMAAGVVPGNPAPDPSLRTATPAALRGRVSEQCITSQARLTQRPRDSLRAPCTCYTGKTFAQMTPVEVTFFRNNGYFDDSAREKALKNIDACGLKRPI